MRTHIRAVLTDLVVPFLAAFVLVAARSFQQRNVQFARYGAMVGTTFVYAFAEAFVVVSYVAGAGVIHVPAVLAYATGGSAGCVLAVMFSKRIFHD